MAFAHAFKAHHEDYCHGIPGRCKTMEKIDGEKLLEKLRKVEFEGLSGDMFEFDNSGDGPARYRVMHFRRVGIDRHEWVNVGHYNNASLTLDMTKVQFRRGKGMPRSVCSDSCLLGRAKKMVEGESCCWHCIQCTNWQIVENETSCSECPKFKVPSEDQTFCMDIPEEYIQLDSWIAIQPMFFASLGLVAMAIVMSVFVRHNDTPVVKASGRELSYVLLSGIFLSYAMTFIFVLKTDEVCGIQRFGLGFCFAVIYSALLTKTSRIARIFNSGKKTSKRPSFISPTSQLCICTAMVVFQVFILTVWSLLYHPKAINFGMNRKDNFLVCSEFINFSYTIVFAYPIGLVVVCTLYAWKTRKIPEAFTESKYIGFTMYTTGVIWLAFVPIYYSTNNDNLRRITTIAVTTSLSGSVALASLFGPKCHIILLHPERNQRISKFIGQKMHSMRSTHHNALASTNSVVAPQRVDTSTQSDVVFPSALEMQERFRAAHGGVYIGGDTSVSCSAVSTQTCTACSSDDSGKDHNCPHLRANSVDSSADDPKCNGARLRLVQTSQQELQKPQLLQQTNGPLQDVPDVML